MSKALLLIDLQNDYFPGGKFPLWNTDATVANVERAIAAATASGIPVVHIQHVADASAGPSPFFNEGSEGVKIHARVRAAAPDAPVVVKAFADSFENTNLEEVLAAQGVDELLIAGMMTQNCVTHAALSKGAEKYDVKVLADCCTTVDEMIHMIALHGMSTRVALVPSTEALAAN